MFDVLKIIHAEKFGSQIFVNKNQDEPYSVIRDSH